MTLPDSITFAGTNEATFDTSAFKKVGIGPNLPFPLWKVTGYQLIERWFHVKQCAYRLKKGR
jgi:hypothetical protein